MSGIWLRCDSPEVSKRHHAKVYGMASVGSPPMSVPHLDTRIIDNSRHILFGPYAGFSTKFLKHGSLLDLFMSIRPGNIWPLMEVGLHNFDLTEYLVEQVVQSPKDRFATLTTSIRALEQKDWKLEVAGMRVQIIKRDPVKGGILKFGTEIVTAADRSLVALLGASPGASTAAAIMIKVLGALLRQAVSRRLEDQAAADHSVLWAFADRRRRTDAPSAGRHRGRAWSAERV